MRRLGSKLTAILASRWFYRGVIIFFVIEALWIALSAGYPMAFDEEFHFGVIKLYAENWLPFLPPDAGSSGEFGAITRDSSFLFHWLMSFPYRLITLFTDSHVATVIILRILNVGMFTAGLVLFYRFMRRVGTSAAFSNTALALVALIPVVPLFAGQINYDNLMMLFVAWTCLLVLELYNGFRRREFDVRLAALLLAVCVFGSLVKYAFLPIAVVVVLFVGVSAWRSFRTSDAWRKALQRSYKTLSTGFKVGITALLLIGGILAFERYGGNTLKYGSPLSGCDRVMTVEQCMNFGPWGRDYQYAQTKGNVNANPLRYTQTWLKGMHKRLFFMINGKHHHVYQNYPPPPIIANTATTLAIGGFIALLWYGRRVMRENPVLAFVVIMSVAYSAALWAKTYSDYLATGIPVAINGRYLIPILLPLAAAVGAALHLAFRRIPSVKPFLATAAILLFLQAGGVFSFIIRSDTTWYWDNAWVDAANNAVRRVVDPLMIEGGTTYK